MYKCSITIIIPARNEEDNIKNVIEQVKSNHDVKQIIVVDNNSQDKTAEYSKECGAEVVFCNNQGKGYAMEMGLKYAKNDIIAFVDADIVDYSRNMIELLTAPLLKDEADFVKSTFTREGGRVTELVAKPLLKILYPEMYRFSQPLSGMIAGKKKFFEEIEFEKDYGVDIGILLDMIKNNARVIEIDIGHLTNNSHDWKSVNKMAEEVMEAIIKRRYK